MTDDNLHPARRFLHICYCCNDVDPITDFFVETLGLRNVMRTPVERGPGELLGLDEVEGAASFVYDYRGGKVSPAIEIQSWTDPPLVGVPSLDPFEIGAKSLGFSVPSVDATLEKMMAAGCKVVSTESSPFGPVWTTVVDSTGVTLELVEDASLTAGPSQLRHLRITCADVEKSIAWYENLGFALLERVDVESPSFLGYDGLGEGKAARLRLPDEPFEVVLIEWTNPVSRGAHYDRPNHAGIFRCALHVYDTQAATDAMKAAGTEFLRGPINTVLNVAAQLDMWLSFLNDPDGILYEFVGRPASAFKKG
jgi:catechol 2,3-dioxygenase-like lactoylglutathione lyase family enzyme